MRRTKRFASFALAACVGASLLVNVPAGTVSAAEPDAVVTAEATETDAEALNETQEVVYDESEADENGFVWNGTTLWKYVGKGGDVKIPEGCTSIEYDAFYKCSGLTSIEIPSSVTSIGQSAFEYCSGLTSIEIPSSVTSIGWLAFSECENLESIVVAPENTTYNSDSDCNAIIETKTNTLIQGCKNTKIPSSVTRIEDRAFGGCSGMTSIEIPSGVTSIEEDAFLGCNGLTSIVVSDSNLTYNSNGDCNAIIETKTNTLIRGCENTKIPSSVTSIGGGAFSGCNGLTSIEIPLGVTSIGNYAFSGCDGLTSIEIPLGVTSIGESAFKYCSGLTSINLPEGVTCIEKETFEYCSGLASIEIPSSVTSIGDYAFSDCSGLASIKILPGVTSIGEHTFSGCSGLTSIEIPSSVTSIGKDAFYKCSGLTSIEIPSSVTSIGDYAFEYCSGLKSIVVSPENKTYNSAGNCNAIIETKTNTLIRGCKNTKIPSSVTSIEAFAFCGCNDLTNIKIPSSVKSIGHRVFWDCSSLTGIEIPSSVTSIDGEAFWFSALKTIYGTSGSYAETFAKKNGYQFVDITVPTVTNVKAAAAGKNKVKVTWDKVSGATGYIVYARKNGKYAKLGVTATTNYTDTKALDNDYNFYFVYAYKKVTGDKIVTGKCQKYAYAKGTCVAVTNLKASSVKGGVKLTWTKSAGADGYIVYGKKTNFKYGYIGMTTKNTATSYTDTKADKGNYNFYWVFPYHYDKNGKRVIGPICGYVYGRAK